MTKLGLHFQCGVPGWAAGVVPAGAWYKLIDPMASDPLPGRRCVGRVYVPDGESNSMVARGAAGADEWFARCRSVCERAPWVAVWEGPNEPGVASREARAVLVTFTRRWVQLMHTIGRKVAVYSLGVGWPDIGQAFELAGGLANADYLALHEYAAPDMRSDQTWLCLRYRRTVAQLRAAGVQVPPLIISECGIDGGTNKRPGVGWKGYTGERGYLDQLQWYAEELERDEYVLAATVFTAAANGDWQSFEVTEDLARGIYQVSGGAGEQRSGGEDQPEFSSAELAIIEELEAQRALMSTGYAALLEVRGMVSQLAPHGGGSQGIPTGGSALPRPTLGRPVKVGDVSQWFGENPQNYAAYGLAGHEGIDYGVPVGTPVHAAHAGKVGVSNAGVYGLHVTLVGGGMMTVYAHLSEVCVSDGQEVGAGVLLGKSGNSGRSSGPHLHFGWKVDGARNPAYDGWLDPALGRLI